MGWHLASLIRTCLEGVQISIGTGGSGHAIKALFPRLPSPPPLFPHNPSLSPPPSHSLHVTVLSPCLSPSLHCFQSIKRSEGDKRLHHQGSHMKVLPVFGRVRVWSLEGVEGCLGRWGLFLSRRVKRKQRRVCFWFCHWRRKERDKDIRKFQKQREEV